MKILSLFALLIMTALPAYSFEGYDLNTNVGGRLLVPGESVAAFSSRIRNELSCFTMKELHQEYQATRADLDRTVKESFDAVSRSLDQWDAELWRLSGHAFHYTGAIGNYARRVDEYSSNLAENQLKLQIFASAFDGKLTECYKSEQK